MQQCFQKRTMYNIYWMLVNRQAIDINCMCFNIIQEDLLLSNNSSPLPQRRHTEVVSPEKCSEKIKCGWEENETFHCQRLAIVDNLHAAFN